VRVGSLCLGNQDDSFVCARPLRLCETVLEDRFEYYTLSPARGGGEGKNVSQLILARCLV